MTEISLESRCVARFRLVTNLLIMSGLQLVPFGYLIWGSCVGGGAMPSAGTLAPMIVICVAVIALPLCVAIGLRRGHGLVACRVVLVVMIPFVMGELGVPILLVIKRTDLPAPVHPMLAASVLHSIYYVRAWRLIALS